MKAMKHKSRTALFTAGLLAATVFAVTTTLSLVSDAYAAGGKVTSPTGTAPDRYVYYPGTEELSKDEIRLFACGTGMPAARRDQAATQYSFLTSGNHWVWR